MKSYRQLDINDGSQPDKASWSIAYLIDAPWAHPIWSQYILLGYPLDAPKVIRYRDDVNHEVMLFALDPEYPVKPEQLRDQKISLLQPANCGYQLNIQKDDFIILLDRIIEDIDARRLSPDTDFRFMWNDIFVREHGGVSLLKSAFDAK